MKRGELLKKILLTVAMGGIFASALVAPGILITIAHILKLKKGYEKSEKRKIAQALSYLRKNKLVILKQNEDAITVQLAENGKRKIKQYQIDQIKIEKPAKWDGKWRVVLFDVPEKKKTARNALRERLQNLGFYQIQKSAWALPWPCENEIQLTAELCEVTSFIQIIKAEKISNDVKLKSHFHLFT